MRRPEFAMPLGRRIVELLLDHPRLRATARVYLGTRDRQTLYDVHGPLPHRAGIAAAATRFPLWSRRDRMGLSDPLNAWLRRLALVAVGLTPGSSGTVVAELGAIPRRAVQDALDDAETEDWPDDDRLRVLALCAHDRRPAVRSDVASSLIARPAHRSAEGESLLSWLVDDPDADVRLQAGHALGALLQALDPFDHAPLIARWALDPLARKRVALATALATGPEVLGGRTALSHLSRDRYAQVRYAAMISLEARARRRG